MLRVQGRERKCSHSEAVFPQPAGAVTYTILKSLKLRSNTSDKARGSTTA